MARVWTHNSSEVDDIAQDSCLKLVKSIKDFSFKSTFSTWLYRVVATTAITTHHKKKFLCVDISTVPDIIIENVAESRLYAKQILSRLDDLAENERIAVLLTARDGFSHLEAADIMGCKEGTVSWYIHEARKKLKD